MAFNPNIAMGYQPMQLKDPMQSYGQIAAIQNAQNQNALAQYQLGAAQRSEDQALALGKAYAAAVNPDTGDVDQNALIRNLAGGAGATQIPAALKATIEAQSAKANLQKVQQEGLKLAFERARALLPSIKDQSGYDAWKGFAIKDFPGLAGVLPDQYSPESIRAIALDADKLYEQHFVPQSLGGTTQVLGMNKYGGGQAAVIPNSVAQVTMSPAEAAANRVAQGNLAVSQGNLRLAQQNANKGQVVETENGPVLVDPRTGKVTALTSPAGEPLAGKGGAFTEGQTNAAMFALRMRDASKVIDSLSSGDQKLASATPGMLSGALPENAQKAQQAKLDFITAVLRKESGAAIGADEFSSADKMYFPKVGDSDAVIQQKAQARRNALAGMESAAGKALQAAQKMRDKGQPQPTVDIDKLLNKYK